MEKVETFEGVTKNELQIGKFSYLELKFGSMYVMYPCLVAENIAYEFIIGNDILTTNNCDINTSEGVIKFSQQRVAYELFRSTVNSICPVICIVNTTIGPYEEVVIPAFLNATSEYDTNNTLLFEPDY